MPKKSRRPAGARAPVSARTKASTPSAESVKPAAAMEETKDELSLASVSAAGIRLLRERVEASGGPKRETKRLAGALARLEAEYERVHHLTSTRLRGGMLPGGARRQLFEATAGSMPPPRVEVSFVPSAPAVVDAMLVLAGITPQDVVFDLGCGDGRIVIAAARQYGARGVGIDIDPARVQQGTESAAEAGVSDRVSFRQADLFTTDLREATVVMLYLLPAHNLELRERLRTQLRPGTRIVSHAFDMGDWPPARQVEVSGSQVYLWIAEETAENREPV